MSFRPESRERQGSVDYVKTTNFTKRGSTASLPYDMFPSAAPPIVQPSTLKRQNVKTSPKETQRLSTASLPYDIFPTVAPPIVQPSTNTSFINAKPSRDQLQSSCAIHLMRFTNKSRFLNTLLPSVHMRLTSTCMPWTWNTQHSLETAWNYDLPDLKLKFDQNMIAIYFKLCYYQFILVINIINLYRISNLHY